MLGLGRLEGVRRAAAEAPHPVRVREVEMHETPEEAAAVVAGVRESERPLDAHELEDALLELTEARDENGRRRRKRRVRWDARARDQVERDCTEAGQEIPDFDWWWDEVAQGAWRTKTASSGPVVVHVSSHHSSNGVGGMNGGGGGFDGGSGGGAYGGFGGCF